MSKFARFLRAEFEAYKEQEGSEKTVVDWSLHLGVSQPNLSRWMNDKAVPDEENVKRLVSKLGLRVYDALGLVRPITDERLREIYENWDTFPESVKDEMAAKALRVQERGDGQKAKKRS